MALKVLQKHWNQSGKWDSLWAILTWDDKKGNKSDRNAPQTSSVRDEMTVSTDSVAQNVPLVVDLDGTLLRTRFPLGVRTSPGKATVVCAGAYPRMAPSRQSVL